MTTTRTAAASRYGSLTPSFRGGRGEPLVLLHGLSMSWRAWRPVLGALTAERDVFAPTLPGHRGGPPLPARADIGSLADQIERRLDVERIPAAHLAGNSMGGWVALELARRGRATRVTAFSPAGMWTDQSDLTRLQLAVTAVRLTMSTALPEIYTLTPRLRRLLLIGLMQHGERLAPAEARQILRDIRGCALIRDRTLSVRHQVPMAAFDACPVHVVWGRRDRTLPVARYGATIHEVLPTARLTVLPAAGHVPMYDEPAEVARILLEPGDGGGR